ncbi:MAG: hypothetical protein ACR2MD_01585 [Aridibacter sp.]
MNCKQKASGAVTLDALNKSLIKNQQHINNDNYNSIFDEKRRIFRYFCSMCKQELTDGSIIYKGIAACSRCLWIWATLRTNLHDAGRCKRKPKIISMHKCFGCEDHFAAKKMSSCLVVCKSCIQSIKQKDQLAKRELIEKYVQRISEYLRRRTI